MNEERYCIVNIWTSEKNKLLTGSDWGHVSLKTHLAYYSLWPAQRTEEERSAFRQALDRMSPKRRQEATGKHAKLYSVRPAHFMREYQDDLDAKNGHEPEVRLAFYSLDAGLIHKFFVDTLFPSIQKSGGWRLIGSNTLSRIGNSAESCASLIYRLLLAGGLKKLVKAFELSSISSENSSAVKPDKLLEQMLLAKVNELAKYEETARFYFEGQSDAVALKAYLKNGGQQVESNDNSNNDDNKEEKRHAI